MIQKVIYPFEPLILSRNIQVMLSWKKDCQEAIYKLDQIKYQLILFNIIQNAIKYNKYNGNIIIILNLKPIIFDNSIQNYQEEKRMK